MKSLIGILGMCICKRKWRRQSKTTWKQKNAKPSPSSSAACGRTLREVHRTVVLNPAARSQMAGRMRKSRLASVPRKTRKAEEEANESTSRARLTPRIDTAVGGREQVGCVARTDDRRLVGNSRAERKLHLADFDLLKKAGGREARALRRARALGRRVAGRSKVRCKRERGDRGHDKS